MFLNLFFFPDEKWCLFCPGGNFRMEHLSFDSLKRGYKIYVCIYAYWHVGGRSC